MRILSKTYRQSAFARSVVFSSLLVLLASCTGHVVQNPKSIEHQERVESRNKRWLEGVPTLDELAKRDIIDPQGGLDRNDYYDEFLDRNRKQKDFTTRASNKRSSLAGFNQLLVTPKKPVIAHDKLVTLSVTDSVPLKDVLIELSRRADVDVEIDPKIQGGIIFRAKDRPFSDVIERIARMTGLRYSVDNGVLRIERDLPVIKSYRLNLLNMVRTSSSSVSINTNLITGGAAGEGGASEITSGSTSELSASSENGDTWGDIETGVTNILSQLSASLQQQRVVAVVGEDVASGIDGDEESNTTEGTGVLSVNRQAGVITILGTEKQHSAVKNYLDRVHKSLSSQVLIEAKVLEVSLSDEYRSGIDWDIVNSNTRTINGVSKNIFAADSSFSRGSLGATGSTDGFTLGTVLSDVLGINSLSIGATVDLVEQFGTSRTLSSPRLHAMNNQYAVLTFAENFVYFSLDLQEEEEDNGAGGTDTTISVTSEIQTVPIGVILALQPSIDLARNEVVMNVRPTLSRVSGQVSDPAVDIIALRNGLADSLVSNIPVIEVRELDTVLRLKSGQVMVIGGLIEERISNIDTGVPGISKTPIIGNAFKNVSKTTEVVETVIFIKATIIPGEGVTVEDQNFYNKFTTRSL